MPSYLFPEQPVAINPYQHPLELFGKALMLKDAKFKQSLSNIRTKYDSLLSTPLTNGQNEATLRTGVENVMNQLSKAAVTDLSLPENQASIEKLFDPILNNDDILYDMSWTSNYKRELDKAETLQKNHPELVKPQNLHPLYKAQEAYRNGDPKLRPAFQQFTPYDDYNTRFNGELDKIKEDVEVGFIKGKGLKVQGPDGQVYNIDDNNPIAQQQVKAIKDWKVQQMLWQRLNADPTALNQMRLDHEYNKDYGFYSPESALGDIDQHLDYFTKRGSVYRNFIDSGAVSPDQAEEYENLIKTGNERIGELKTIRQAIQSDPSKSSEYFTFNKFIKDYVEGKSSQYSHREDGLLQDVPGYSKIRDAELDMLKEQYKNKNTVSAATLQKQTEIQQAYDRTAVPYIDLVEQLAESPEGIQTTPANIQALGNMSKLADGTLKYNMAFHGVGDGSMVILSPAEGKMTKEQVETVYAGTYMSGLKSELQTLGLKTFLPNAAPQDLSGMSVVPGDHEVPQTADEIIKNYVTNPNSISTADRKKIEAVFNKYAPILEKVGINIKNYDDINKLKNKISDPSIENAITTGTVLNSALTGKFSFIPDQDTNVVQGQNGQIYISGYVEASDTQLRQAGMTPSALVSHDLARKGNINPVTQEDSKQLRVGEKFYQVHVYIPVNGDVKDVNDKMLDAGEYLKYAQDGNEYRTISREKLTKYADTVLKGQGAFNKEFADVLAGKTDNDVYKEINRMASSMATYTGKDTSELFKQIVNDVSLNKNPLKRYSNFLNYQNNTSLVAGLDTLPAKLNNPLAITDKTVGSIKATGEGGKDGLSSFLTIQDGLSAGYLKLQNIYQGNSTTYKSSDTLSNFNSKWTPRAEEKDQSLKLLITNLKSLGLNVSESTPINQIPIKALFQAIAMKEDGSLFNYLKSNKIIDNFLNSI